MSKQLKEKEKKVKRKSMIKEIRYGWGWEVNYNTYLHCLKIMIVNTQKTA